MKNCFFVPRCVLRGRSSFFRAMFDSGMRDSKTEELEFDDVCPELFEILLKFMCTGCIKFETNKNIDYFKLLQLADRFKILGFIDYMQTECLRYITVENVVDFILFAEACVLTYLYNGAFSFGIVNYPFIPKK
eukprot:UN24121